MMENTDFFPKEKEKGIYSWILPMEVVTKGITGMPPDLYIEIPTEP